MRQQVDANHKDFWRSVEKVESKHDGDGVPVVGQILIVGAVIFLFLLWHQGPEFWKRKS